MNIFKVAKHYHQKLAQEEDDRDTIPAPPPSGLTTIPAPPPEGAAQEFDFEDEDDDIPESEDYASSDLSYNKSLLRTILTKFLDQEKAELESDPSYDSNDFEDLERTKRFFNNVLMLVDKHL